MGLHGPLPLQDRAQTSARASGRHSGNDLGDGGVGSHRAIRPPVLQEAILAAEHLLGLEGESKRAKAKRARTEIRLDSGWGGEAMITWLLERGYQVTGKFKSSGRVRKLVGAVTTWSPTSSPGREVAPVPKPVTDVAPVAAICRAHSLQRA